MQRLLLTLALAAALTGCGQKGPLYLPDSKPPQKPPTKKQPAPKPPAPEPEMPRPAPETPAPAPSSDKEAAP